MALSLFGRRRSDDPFDSFFSGNELLPFPSFSSPFMRFPDHPNFARDVAAIANTQVDWVESADAHNFKVNLPGLAKDEVKVQVEDGRVLQISGERKKEETSSTDRWHRVERAHGSFLRRFRLPENAKVEELKAAMENGVLTITVPKIASLESKRSPQAIDITS